MACLLFWGVVAYYGRSYYIYQVKNLLNCVVGLVRAEIKNGDGLFTETNEMILQSVEYCPYKEIIKKYKSYSVEKRLKKMSKEGNWEWVIKFFNTKISDDYYIYMVTQNGDVLLLEVCCI